MDVGFTLQICAPDCHTDCRGRAAGCLKRSGATRAAAEIGKAHRYLGVLCLQVTDTAVNLAYTPKWTVTLGWAPHTALSPMVCSSAV